MGFLRLDQAKWSYVLLVSIVVILILATYELERDIHIAALCVMAWFAIAYNEGAENKLRRSLSKSSLDIAILCASIFVACSFMKKNSVRDIKSAFEALALSNFENMTTGEYDRDMIRSRGLASSMDILESHMQFDPYVSIVVPCYSDNKYVITTVSSILKSTPGKILKEILIIDDGNSENIQDIIQSDSKLKSNSFIRVIRNHINMGLIASKFIGAEQATGSIIIFLDCHIVAHSHWLGPLLVDLHANPDRIVVPAIYNIDQADWPARDSIDEARLFDTNDAIGYKMKINWDHSFSWFHDGNDRVPIISGGIFATTRSFLNKTRGWDKSLEKWGGENIDISIRAHAVGGSVLVNRDSKIGHLFRSEFPYSMTTEQVRNNVLQVATVWFDEWYAVVSTKMHKKFHRFPNRSQIQKMELERIAIAPHFKFIDYIHKFRDVYLDANSVNIPEFILTHPQRSSHCLSPALTEKDETLILFYKDCVTSDSLGTTYFTNEIFWGLSGSDNAVASYDPDVPYISTILRNIDAEICLTAVGSGRFGNPVQLDGSCDRRTVNLDSGRYPRLVSGWHIRAINPEDVLLVLALSTSYKPSVVKTAPKAEMSLIPIQITLDDVACIDSETLMITSCRSIKNTTFNLLTKISWNEYIQVKNAS